MADLDIAAFLRDRFDEDEFVAGQTHWGRCGIWRDFHEVCDCYAKPRALADVEVKRQMLDEHHDDGGHCDVCADPPQYDATWQPFPCRTVRLLALPYAEHPEFREEWKP